MHAMRNLISTITGLTLALALTGSLPLGAAETVPRSVSGKQSARSKQQKQNVATRKKAVRTPPLRSGTELNKKVREPIRIIKTVIPPSLDLANLQTTSVGVVCGWYLESLAQAETFVDAIVVGKPAAAYPRRDHFVAYNMLDSPDPANPLMSGVWSVGPFHIDRILYQKSTTGKNGLIDGQSISLSEPVGIMLFENRYVSLAFHNCNELKQNSQYVLFLHKRSSTDGKPLYATCNLELGRFNTDGTDPDGSIGLHTWKQLIRNQLTAKYGIMFAPVDFGSSEIQPPSP